MLGFLLIEDAKLEVKQWIDSAGCIQYYDTFIDEGFDDMESLSLIKEEDLTAMKLKLGFKRKILSKLNPAAPASSPASESGLLLSPWLDHFL